jgi:hypothetical protein
MEEEMKLHELKSIIDGLVEIHGDDMEAVFKYRFGSGRTSQGPVTCYQVSPPNQGVRGYVRFTIDYARGEPQ